MDDFDLYLFDFDGLLVSTEELHFRAYREICRRRGFHLPWTSQQYFDIAQAKAGGVKNGLTALFPSLLEEGWEVLDREKRAIYEALVEKEGVTLCAGVEPLLEKLSLLNKKRCVVTNSPRLQVEMIKRRLPILQTIPRWFTRESYLRPKPAPDGYLTALGELRVKGDRVVGFEDTIKGYQSLKEAGVDVPVLISRLPPLDSSILYFPSLTVVNLH